MAEFFIALAEHPFLVNALLAGIFAGIGCGLIGSFVVIKRIGFLAGGIAHSVLGGMGAALYYGYDPTISAFSTAIFAAIVIGLISRFSHEKEDTLIAAIWAVGMAIGIIFISQTPGYNTELMTYLFGNILIVSEQQVLLMALLNIVIGVFVFVFYKVFLAISFDEEFAKLRGVKVTLAYLLLLCLVAVTVVLLIQVVGLILVIALLTLPAAIAGHYMKTLAGMIAIAVLLGMSFTSLGLALSYSPDLPPGPVTIIVAAAVYIVSLLFSRLLRAIAAARAVNTANKNH